MASQPPIIGVTGLARVGKDAVTDALLLLGGAQYSYSFANPLRAMLKAGFDIDMNERYWRQHKEDVIPALGKSPRQLMQTLGTEWGRVLVSDDIWLVLAAAKLIKHGPGMVLPDVRFENEAKWIRDRGGTIIHVTRPNIEAVSEHVSEKGIKAIPGEVFIVNDGTLADLEVHVKSIVDGWNET